MMFENSTNRNLFSSYDRLNALLASSDLDVVVSVLQLQYSAKPAVAHVLRIASGRLESLSRLWTGLRDHGLEVADLVSPKKSEEVDELPASASDVRFTYYPRASDSKEPAAEPEGNAPPQTPAKKPAATVGPNGPKVVQISSVATSNKEPMAILRETIEAHHVPESEQFELMCKIRTAWALGKSRKREREQLVIIRMLSIAVYARTQSESHAQAALFLYEPDLVSHLAEVLQFDRDAPIAVQSAAISALDGLVRYRSKMQEVLTALNVGVNHGVLMALLRKIVAEAASPESTISSAFIETVLSFVSHIASHAAGGNMIIGAGLVPVLIQIMDNTLPSMLSVVSKAMSLLDSVLYGFSNAFSILCNAHGVESLVARVEHEADLNLAEHSQDTEPRLSAVRTNVLKHLLRSVHRMMQSPGTTEGLRGLIDSSLPKTIKKIFQNKALFGPVVLPLAINIMSTFVHNEPTSLAVMQESGLPETFYDTIEGGLEPSIEVLQAIPNAIGALCLNQDGQDQLAARQNIIPMLFATFTSEKHVKVLHDKENATIMGSAIDELIRHHPNLKTAVFDAVIATLTKIEELGNAYIDPKGGETPFRLKLVARPADPVAQPEITQGGAMELGQPRPPAAIPVPHVESQPATQSTHAEPESVEYTGKQQDDNIIVTFVDVIGRFLEGLFQHTPHCREFVTNTDGLERLGRLFTLPSMPADFGGTEYFLQVIRTIAEVEPTQTLQKLAQHVKSSLEETRDFWKDMGATAKFADWVAISSDGALAEANIKFRRLITLNTRISMLAEVYSATSIAHGRSASASLQNITATETAALLPALGDVHRAFIWEVILLRSAVAPTESPGLRIHSMEYGSVPIDLLPEGFSQASSGQPASSGAPAEEPAPQCGPAATADTARKQNITALKHLAGQIPNSVTLFLQALIKMVIAGRCDVDSAHKKHATQMAKHVADILVNHLAWDGTEGGSPLAVSAYHTVMIGFASVLLTGDPPGQGSLQTLLLITIWQAGAVRAIINIGQRWVDAADSVMHLKHAERTDLQNQSLIHAFGGLKVTLHLLHQMTSSKALFESTQAPLLITRDLKDTDKDYFEPHDLLVKLRASVLPLVARMWTPTWVTGPPLSITKSIVRSLLEIMRADKEDASADPPMVPPIPAPGGHVSAHTGPVGNRIQQLTEMGFPRSAAERALVRTGNNVNAATEYLLSHPLPFPPDPEQAPEEDAPPAAIQQGAGPHGQHDAATDAPAAVANDANDGQSPSEDAEMQETQATSDKGKAKESEAEAVPVKPSAEWKEELQALRAKLQDGLAAHAFKLVDENPNLIFDVKSAFLGSAGGSTVTALKLILEDIKTFSPSAYDVHEQPLAVRLRLLGVILTDSPLTNARLSSGDSRDLMNVLVALILSQEPSGENSLPPKWVGALLLVAELLLALSEEAPAVTLPETGQEVVRGPLAVGPDCADARPKLFGFALKLLQSAELIRDDMLAVLRILVLLTRDATFASEFVRRDGLARLVQLFKDSHKTVAGLESYVAILMRHAVEDKSILRSIITQEIKRFFNQSRGRLVDITSFMRGGISLVLRDPEAFIDAAGANCELTGTNFQHISLKSSQGKAAAAPEDTPCEAEADMQVDELPTSVGSQTLVAVVHFLTSELMRVIQPALDHADGAPPTSAPSADTATAPATALEAHPPATTTPAATAPASEPTDPLPDGRRDFAYACFLMRCLTEMLFSYEPCKTAFLSYSRTKTSAIPAKESKSRPTTLHFLLHEIISYGDYHNQPATDGARRRMLLCNWASSVVVALSVDVSYTHDFKDVSADLVAVRETVVGAVNKAIKESSTTEPVAARYGRLLAMAELCHRLASVKVQSSGKSHEDVAIHTAKIMLEKGFVATLTNALADVDLNYPHVKTLISAVLRPLEYLTRIAINMGRTTDRSKADKEDAMSTDYDEDEDVDRAETPDLYRNSALGMYGGEIDDVNYNDEDDDMDEDEEMVEEGADFDGETGSDHTSASSDEEGDPDGDELDMDEGLLEAGWHDEDEDMEDDEDTDGEGGEADEEGEEEMVWEDIPEGEAVLDSVGDDGDDEDAIEPDPIMGDALDEDEDMGSDEQGDDLRILEPSEALHSAASEDPFAARLLGALAAAGLLATRNARGLFAASLMHPRGGGLEAELQMFGRRHTAGHPAAPDAVTHPLLMDPTNQAAGAHQHRIRARAGRGVGANYNDLIAAVEEVVGGGAFQFLQRFIQRTRPGETFQLQLPAGTLAEQLERHPHRRAHDHGDLQPKATSTRWAEEVQISHGKFAPGRMEKLTNHVVLALLPAAREAAAQADARLKEEEERLLREREESARAEATGADVASFAVPSSPAPAPALSVQTPSGLENQGSVVVEPPTDGDALMEDVPPTIAPPQPDADAQLVDSAAVSIEPITVGDDGAAPATPDAPRPTQGTADAPSETQEPAPAAEGAEAGPSQPAPRVIVRVNGAEIDITDTSIDPEFLEALPDDMREEVLNQHFRERAIAQQQIPADSHISAEFLEALPPDIRAELVQQESAERRRQQAAAQAATVTNTGPSDIDPASFLASLHPHLRQAVLLEQDGTFLQILPSAMIAEAGGWRAAAHRRFAGDLATMFYGPEAAPAASSSKRPTMQRDAIQLLDKNGIATLVRLLYFPQVSKKTLLLHKVLVNLCENSKSRTELLDLLLSILNEGTGDLLAVDKSPSQLCVRAGKTASFTTPKATTPQAKNSVSMASALQIFSQLPSESIPNLVAQRSLEALAYIVSNNELSSLFFLSEQDAAAGLRRSTSRKGKGKKRQTPAVHYPVVALLNLLDRQLVLKTVSIVDSIASLLAIVTKPLTTLKKPGEAPAPQSDNSAQAASETSPAAVAPAPSSSTPDPAAPSSSAEPTATPAAAPSDVVPAPADEPSSLLSRPPVVQAGALRLIVNILTGGECSSRTFEHSLTLINNLACLPESCDTIASELRLRAQDLGSSIYMDLDELVKQLTDDSLSASAATTIAVRFSPASSDQAKLLRVLKTIDYMYSPRSSPGSSAEERTQDDANKLNAVYQTFKFSSLWRRLGDVLSILQEKSDVEHAATVLLPLIESLMVVCKHVGTKTGRAVRATSPRSPVTPCESMEELFVGFTDVHRRALNLMVRNNPSLMSGSFSLLVHNPRVLDFDNKRNYFNQQLHRRPANREHHGTLQLNVRRARVFEDSFQYLQRRTGDQVKYGKLSVRFYDEEGLDAGGVTREWFQILARQMFNPDYCLFQPCAADKLTYQPNRASAVHPEHLSFFKFVGRVIGKALYDGRLLDAYFARSLYRQLLGKPVDYRDVEWVDPSYYSSLCWLLENDPAPLDMTFSIDTDEFGVTKVVPLKENGASIPVTIDNRREFVQLAAEYRLYSSIKDQIESLLGGFYEIIPKDLISIFNEQEVELLISGTPDVDVDEWRAATEYNGYTPSDPVIVWWWRALKSFSRDERAKVLGFATGTSRVPLGGFVELQGVQGVQRFSIHKAYGGTDRLPQAHTCFNQVDLPQYPSYEMLRAQLLLAINEGGEGFGFA
ncbi:hypothetical protein AURDEDRAFT_109329 [Auricularia subglabra TFB-10046 SS5]|uniref:HECT-type E3 ubiquitin transferase n=1 Tax=Auricularia subglabra (strain TFB-10046 / SS5) TaxID=717982 RepID=J0D5P6_AURST|nr:hypothetical protein AURDEDRAFT_109329 [Auricularia subglabra TFB-10046 SS5]